MDDKLPDSKPEETYTAVHPSRAQLLLAFDRELPPAEVSFVLEHVGRCPECESRWTKLHVLSDRIAALESPTKGPVFELRLPSGNVVDQLRVQRRGSSRLVKAYGVKAYGLVAAALTLAAGLWLLTRSPLPPKPAVLAKGTGAVVERDASAKQGKTRTDRGSRRQTIEKLGGLSRDTRVRWARVPQTQAPAVAANIDPTPAVARRVPRKRTAPQTTVRAPREADSEEVFWALPYSNPALIGEGVHLVRVALPREAFLMAGVPVAELPGSGPREPVLAEVLLGSDGLPSAIRPAHYQRASYSGSPDR